MGTLRVDYMPSKDQSRTSFHEKNGKKYYASQKMKLSVWIDKSPQGVTAPIIDLNLDLSQIISLESGSGKAWIGTTAALPSLRAADIGVSVAHINTSEDDSSESLDPITRAATRAAIDGAGSVEVLSWAFAANTPRAPDFDAWRHLALNYHVP